MAGGLQNQYAIYVLRKYVFPEDIAYFFKKKEHKISKDKNFFMIDTRDGESELESGIGSSNNLQIPGSLCRSCFWKAWKSTSQILFIYNPGHNILRHFDVSQNVRVTTSETNRDY